MHQDTFVSCVISTDKVDIESLVARLNCYRKGNNDPRKVIFHLDISSCASENINALLFQLLFLKHIKTKSGSHFHVKRTLAWIERLKPKRAVLTHMTADLDYETLRRDLPDGVEPAYDGMEITF